MRTTKFSEEQITVILNELAAGAKLTDVCRKHNVCDKTIYKWRARYGGMEVSEIRHIKSLEEKVSKLERIVAGQAVELLAARDLLSKKW